MVGCRARGLIASCSRPAARRGPRRRRFSCRRYDPTLLRPGTRLGSSPTDTSQSEEGYRTCVCACAAGSLAVMACPCRLSTRHTTTVDPHRPTIPPAPLSAAGAVSAARIEAAPATVAHTGCSTTNRRVCAPLSPRAAAAHRLSRGSDVWAAATVAEMAAASTGLRLLRACAQAGPAAIKHASGAEAKDLRRRLEALAPRGACAAAAFAAQRRGVGLERETVIVPHRALPPPALHAEALSGSQERIAIAARAEGCASWACRSAAQQVPWVSRTRAMRAEMAASGSLDRSCAAARDPNLPVALSSKAASHESRSVREALASNERCPGQILTLLSTDASMEVRRETASNERCPSLVLSRLCGDEAESVGYYVAANAKLPEAALRAAAQSPRVLDRSGAAHNPACPQDLFSSRCQTTTGWRCCRNSPPTRPARLIC